RNPAVRQHEDPAVFQEEGPLLRKKAFEDREVEHRGIRLDLPEIRVDGRGERGRGPDAHPQVGASTNRFFRRDTRSFLESPERVRQELDTSRRRQPIVEDQMTVARYL